MKKSQLEEEHNNLMKVIFGDEETGVIGMRTKVDEIHDILVSIKSVSKFVGGIGTTLKWLLVIAGVIGVIKGWWFSILGFLLSKSY
jgi:hypothetical protein